MKMQKFNAGELKLALLKMDPSRMLAFGLLCAERMLPNYIAFQRQFGWGDTVKLQDALALASKVAFDQFSRPHNTNFLIESCESQAPSSDQFDSLLVTAAQDVCFAICCLLDFINDVDVEKIVQAATYSIDSIDLYVQEIEKMNPEDPRLEGKILLHPLMQEELKAQHCDLKDLLLAPELSEDLLNKLRSNSKKKELGTLRALSLDS